jgi:hypothetical protein
MTKKVANIANAYHQKTGKKLVVTSGTRTARDQARAMLKKLTLGGDVLELYKNRAAAKEVRMAFDQGRKAGESNAGILADMARVIAHQLRAKVLVSPHLKGAGADIRSRDMSAAEKNVLREVVKEVGGLTMIEEDKPPHFHIQRK